MSARRFLFWLTRHLAPPRIIGDDGVVATGEIDAVRGTT